MYAGEVGSGHWWITCVCQVISFLRATLRPFCVNRILSIRTNMERTRQADRSQLIRFSAVAFAVLALTSFLLARVPW